MHFKNFMYLLIQFWLHWSSLLHVGFLWLQQAGLLTVEVCGLLTNMGGFSHCGGQALGMEASVV